MKYNLTDIQTIRSLMARHGVNFSKALGQNFLINPSVCPQMAELGGAEEGVGALEIGPGVGVLTAELAKRATKVVAIELDTGLIPLLGESLSEFGNVTVINGDVLKIDLKRLLEEQFEGLPVVVCANLPYYITSPVIMSLLEARLELRSITVMVQKEAGKRLCAQPGSREAGAVTLAVHYFAEPHLLFDVSSGSFMPRPNVDSCVIRLDIRRQPPVEVRDEKLLFRLIRASFNQRRKTLLNGLSSGTPFAKEKIAAAISAAGLEPAVRGEKLTLADFARIADELGA